VSSIIADPEYLMHILTYAHLHDIRYTRDLNLSILSFQLAAGQTLKILGKRIRCHE
jgi:hypothetical protein